MRNTRHLCAFLALLTLALTACGGDGSNTGDSSADRSPDTGDTAAAEPARQAEDVAEPAHAAGDATVAADSGAGGDGDPCILSIEAGDQIAYNKDSLSVPSSCAEVTVTLTHTGALPKAAMGHNWVLLPTTASVEDVARAGMRAGIDNGYLPADDERIVAATELIGGGESTSVTFSLSALDEGESYIYVCTFPGHWTAMRGTFSVTG